jgi:single-strand DNA-binding protein
MASEVKLPALNKVMLAGRLTRDPEMRYAGEAPVANLGLAVNRRYKDKTGEWKDDTCFVNVVFWRKQAELVNQYLKKGSAVLVEGRLQSRSWDTKEGEKRNTLEVLGDRVEFLDRIARRGDTPGGEPVMAARDDLDASGPDGGDDIPF